jgi:hypothetical protein
MQRIFRPGAMTANRKGAAGVARGVRKIPTSSRG